MWKKWLVVAEAENYQILGFSQRILMNNKDSTGLYNVYENTMTFREKMFNFRKKISHYSYFT